MSSNWNNVLPEPSALPSSLSSTSTSFSATGLAVTLIWMLIVGCCCEGISERGAFGFSNEKSLTYCANTLSWGGLSPACAVAPAGPPLVGMLMWGPPDATLDAPVLARRLANTVRPGRQGWQRRAAAPQV